MPKRFELSSGKLYPSPITSCIGALSLGLARAERSDFYCAQHASFPASGSATALGGDGGVPRQSLCVDI